MDVLFKKLIRRNHLLDAYRQTLEKFVLPDGSSLQRFVPGIDGLDLKDFQNHLDDNLEDCRQFLMKGDREFLPQLQRRVPKDTEGNWREIYLSSLRDKIIQKAIAMVLWPEIETDFSPNLYSYRLDPKFHQGAAVKRARNYLRDKGMEGWVFRTDISDYTESIPHADFLARFAARFPQEKRIYDLLRLWLRQRRYAGGRLESPEVGMPTGSPLTPLFANFYLAELDAKMRGRGVFYLRYGDDILAMAPEEAEMRRIAGEIRETLRQKGLRLSTSKTVLQPARQSFGYLGYLLDGGKIRVGPKAIDRYRHWIVKTLASARYRRWPNRSAGERRELLRRILQDLQTEQSHVDQEMSWIKSFPYLDDDRDLRELDRFVKDRIRLCVTRESTKKNYRKVPEEWFRAEHYRSFVGAYYRIQRRRPLGPYLDWEKYFGETRVPEPGHPALKPVRRLRAWLAWVRQALDSGPSSGNIRNG